MKKHIELLGILHLVYSSIALFVGIFCFMLLSGIGFLAHDAVALGVLGELFRDRPVIGIHAVDLVLGFGTLHCLTQQEPAA